MKKLSTFLVTALIAVIGFTSCLEDGGNRRTGSAVGILDLSDKSFNYVIKTLSGDLYAPEFTTLIGSGQMNQGAGYLISYEIDFDLPENATEMVMANGYYTVTLLGSVEAERYYLNSYLTDTSAVLPDEMAVTQAVLHEDYGGFNYFAKDYIFMSHLVKQPEDLNVTWDLSYDYEAAMPTEENGRRYYDLFLRATKTNNDEGTAAETLHFNCYYVSDYLTRVASKEKELLGSSYGQSSAFVLRVNYVSEIKDGGELVWENQELPFYISPFVPAE